MWVSVIVHPSHVHRRYPNRFNGKKSFLFFRSMSHGDSHVYMDGNVKVFDARSLCLPFCFLLSFRHASVCTYLCGGTLFLRFMVCSVQRWVQKCSIHREFHEKSVSARYERERKKSNGNARHIYKWELAGVAAAAAKSDFLPKRKKLFLFLSRSYFRFSVVRCMLTVHVHAYTSNSKRAEESLGAIILEP